MTDKTKAPASAATLTGAGTETAAGQAAASCANSITNGANRQPRVSDFLRCGRENALHLRELKQLLHKDGRTVRLMIQSERQHVPIVSDNRSGYWIGTLDEASAFARRMRHRAFEINRTAALVQLAAFEEEAD